MTVVLKDFHAEWCGPCQQQDPIIDELEDDWGDGIEVERIDIDEDPDTAQQYGVRSIPTIVIENDDEVVEQFTGLTPRERLESVLEQTA